MNTLILSDGLAQFNTDTAKVKVVIKVCDATYFTEKVVFQKEISVYLFLLLVLVSIVPVLLLALIKGLIQLWNKVMFWIFSEKDWISVEETRQRLAEQPFFETLSPAQKQQLFSKKDLPLGL